MGSGYSQDVTKIKTERVKQPENNYIATIFYIFINGLGAGPAF